jgi:ketosteroid isomerase-like protein
MNAIIDKLAPDVEWEYADYPNAVPWLQTLRGRDQVPAFFAALGAIELTRFVPQKIFGDAECVVAVLDAAFTVKATGKEVVERDEVHVWHFNPKGQVSRFRHRVDTLQHAAALKGD